MLWNTFLERDLGSISPFWGILRPFIPYVKSNRCPQKLQNSNHGVILRPHGQVLVPGVWPTKVMLGETEVFFVQVNYFHFSVHGPFACPPLCIPLGGRQITINIKRDHMPGKGMISKEDTAAGCVILCSMWTQKKILNGRFNMTRRK